MFVGFDISRLDAHTSLNAFEHAELECADATSAFWQGHGQEIQDSEPVGAGAFGEIARAMKVPLGSAV